MAVTGSPALLVPLLLLIPLLLLLLPLLLLLRAVVATVTLVRQPCPVVQPQALATLVAQRRVPGRQLATAVPAAGWSVTSCRSR